MLPMRVLRSSSVPGLRVRDGVHSRCTGRHARAAGGRAAVGRRHRIDHRRDEVLDQQGRDRRSQRRRPARPAVCQRRRLLDAGHAGTEPGVLQQRARRCASSRRPSRSSVATPDLARVIKARDLNGDGLTDIVVGTTYQTQSRLFLGAGKGRFTEVTAHAPAADAAQRRRSRSRRRRWRWRSRPRARRLGPRQQHDQRRRRDAAVAQRRRGPVHRRDRRADAGDQDSVLVGPRVGRRRQRRRPRRAGVVQALPGQLAVPQRRHRPLHRRRARPAAVHEQLRVRADGSRRRRLSRSRHDERRRDRRRSRRRAGASTCSATTARAASAMPPTRGGRPPPTSARTTTWWRFSTSTPTATPTSSSAR